MTRILIAAAHKSSGKTVISTGLAAAIHARGHAVQCFKKGPDYIDPMWLAAASGRPCYNLDFNTMSADEITALLGRKSADADLALIETNKGLFDGVAPDGADSNAALARLTGTPVVLVIDCVGMTRGIAPLLRGYLAFDPGIQIAGVILNKVGGARHESKLRRAVESYTDIPVLGAIARQQGLDIGERHLGLTTPAETGRLDEMISGFATITAQSVDIDRIMEIAGSARPRQTPPQPAPKQQFSGLKIGIARDVAFGFYYPDDLQAFTDMGAELIPFDTLKSSALPEIDGLFIGGGFPEMRMAELSANQPLREDIRTAINAGLPTYAECGGLMYLCRSLQWGRESHPMCGVFKADAVMRPRPQGRGHTRYQSLPDHPWGASPDPLPAHEFHYAQLENVDENSRFARRILRGHGIDGNHDGLVKNNLLAGFCHLRNSRANPWVTRFLNFVKSRKRP